MTTRKCREVRSRLDEQLAAVRKALGDSVICKRCGATMATYDETCSARLDDPCPGFLTIEAEMAKDYASFRANREG